MSGRQAAPRTRFARLACSDPGVAVFRISGSLGPRAKPQLVRLTQECLRRNMPRVVLDLSEVDALGGGTARLLNEFAAERAGRGGMTAFRVTSRTVRGFLCADTSLPPPPITASLEEAVAAVRGRGSTSFATEPPARRQPQAVGHPVPRTTQPAGQPVRRPQMPPAPPQPREVLAAGPPAAGMRIPSEPGGHGGDDDWDLSHSYAEIFGAPRPAAPIRLDIEQDPPQRGRPGVGWRGLEHASTLEELRDGLVAALHEHGIASRVFLFKRHGDGRYFLATRQGLDPERVLPADGPLVHHVSGLEAPGFLIDIPVEALSEAEAELMSELNCEVVAPIRNNGRADYLVFASKERPGDEYALEELQEFEAVVRAAAEGARREGRAEVSQPPAWDHDPEPQPVWSGSLLAESSWPEVDEDFPPPALRLQNAAAGPQRRVARGVEQDGNPPRARRPVAPARGAAPVWTASPLAVPRATSDDVRALRRSLAQMRDILSLSQDFDATFGTSKLLEVLVLSVVSVARVETVLYFAARDQEYRLTHHRGMPPDAIQGLRLRADSTLVLSAVASQRGLCIAEAAQVTEEERIWARQHGLRFAVPFHFKDEVIGMLLLGDSAEDAPPDLEMLAYLLAQGGLAYDRARLYETLQDRTLGVVRGLITLIEGRNGFDCGSTEQVVRYTQALARELQFPAEALRDLVYGAVLRDVGMLQVSETLLRSAQDLSGDQWEAIRRHPQEGVAIMRQMRFSEVAIDVVLHHHEAYSGEGYPMGLRGRAIPLGARIVAVAESYVKMTMDRPYRKALGKAEALESLAENWGLRYDPLVVDALVRVVNRELSMGLKGDRDLTRDLFGL